MLNQIVRPCAMLAPVALTTLIFAHTVVAGTKCVRPNGAGGCYSSISAAVTAASPSDTIQVFQGTYHEDVIIAMPLSLLGENSANTIIDATGLANGVYSMDSTIQG